MVNLFSIIIIISYFVLVVYISRATHSAILCLYGLRLLRRMDVGPVSRRARKAIFGQGLWCPRWMRRLRTDHLSLRSDKIDAELMTSFPLDLSRQCIWSPSVAVEPMPPSNVSVRALTTTSSPASFPSSCRILPHHTSMQCIWSPRLSRPVHRHRYHVVHRKPISGKSPS